MTEMLKTKTLVLVTDSYGGRGGIALYNRHLIQALCEHPMMEQVTVIPRHIHYELEEMPHKLDYRTEAVGGKFKYLFTCLKILLTKPRFDLIICGHIHLWPIAWFLSLLNRCPAILVVYGIEAWKPTPCKLTNYLCRKINSFISIRRLTAQRLIEWAKISHGKYDYLPNCIDASKFGIKARRKDLIKRYATENKTVIMTAGRLDAGIDLNKGFDEVLEIMPKLKTRIPNLLYLIVGDGEDRARLEAKAKQLGVDDSVLFTGYVSEAEKADHYRLADVFAMPGSNPIFDRYPYRFVFLEALACGIPVVGCKPDDPQEISDPESHMIIQVDPNDPDEIIEGLLKALSSAEKVTPPSNFYFDSFKTRLHEIIEGVLVKQ